MGRPRRIIKSTASTHSAVLYDDGMSNSVSANSRLPVLLQWTAPGRALVFCLAASSIWCLLAEMYNLVDMRTFFYSILLPSTVALYGIAFLDKRRGDGHLWRAVILG